MALQSDASGFLIGRRAADLMRKLAANQDQTNTILRGLRRDTNTLLSSLVASSRRGVSKAPAQAAPRVGVSTPARDPSGRFVARPQMPVQTARPRPTRAVPMSAPAPSAAVIADAKRDGRGRFTAGFGRSTSGGSPAGADLQTLQSAKRAQLEKRFARNDRIRDFFSSRRDTVKDSISSAADADASTAAAKEIGSITGPLKTAVFGTSESRAERRKERRDQRRHQIIEKELEAIEHAIKGTAPGKKQGGGVLGFLASLILPLFAKLGGLLSLGGGVGRGMLGGFGRMKGGLLKRLGKSALKFGPLGLLLGAGELAANEIGPNPAAGRYRIGGAVAGGGIGTAIGAALGSILGPAGTFLGGAAGGVLGSIFGEKVGEWTKSLIDADLPGMIADWFGNLFDQVRNSAPVRAVARGANAVSNFGRSLADRIGMFESGGRYGEDSQRRKFLAGRGNSSASGKYQFLDRTFASVVAESSDPALAGMSPLAKAYIADGRSSRAKASDPKYAALFAAKLNPASAEAAYAEFAGQNDIKLRAAGVNSPTDAQRYSVHLLGNAKFAAAVARNPNAPISSVVDAGQIAANPGLFAGVRTVGDLNAKLHRKVGTTSLSSPVGMNLPPSPAIPAAPPIAAGGESSGPSLQVIPIPMPNIGQNVEDRSIAHAATGGYSGTGR